MKLVTYLHAAAAQVGVLTAGEDAVLPLTCPDMNTLIETMTLEDLHAAASTAGRIPLGEVELLAPIPQPRQDVICLGINYKAHAEESVKYNADAFGGERPVPIYFSKRVTEAVSPTGDIDSHPGLVRQLDYEAELAVIIGKPAKKRRRGGCRGLYFRLHRSQRRVRPAAPNLPQAVVLRQGPGRLHPHGALHPHRR